MSARTPLASLWSSTGSPRASASPSALRNGAPNPPRQLAHGHRDSCSDRRTCGGTPDPCRILSRTAEARLGCRTNITQTRWRNGRGKEEDPRAFHDASHSLPPRFHAFPPFTDAVLSNVLGTRTRTHRSRPSSTVTGPPLSAPAGERRASVPCIHALFIPFTNVGVSRPPARAQAASPPPQPENRREQRVAHLRPPRLVPRRVHEAAGVPSLTVAPALADLLVLDFDRKRDPEHRREQEMAHLRREECVSGRRPWSWQNALNSAIPHPRSASHPHQARRPPPHPPDIHTEFLARPHPLPRPDRAPRLACSRKLLAHTHAQTGTPIRRRRTHTASGYVSHHEGQVGDAHCIFPHAPVPQPLPLSSACIAYMPELLARPCTEDHSPYTPLSISGYGADLTLAGLTNRSVRARRTHIISGNLSVANVKSAKRATWMSSRGILTPPLPPPSVFLACIHTELLATRTRAHQPVRVAQYNISGYVSATNVGLGDVHRIHTEFPARSHAHKPRLSIGGSGTSRTSGKKARVRADPVVGPPLHTTMLPSLSPYTASTPSFSPPTGPTSTYPRTAACARARAGL
ncbi:hypothetical protein DFH06DRAFT_1473002 [Mycena polygramma]|nr:hypothetical protein DFH06DRAFT_1473002 [Mycena polygramma]